MTTESMGQDMTGLPDRQLNPSYIGLRKDVLKLVPRNSRRVLDVGCSVGALGEQIKRVTQASVVGIELDPDMASLARSRLDLVIEGDVEKMSVNRLWPAEFFDCIIFADILEHLREPWTTLQRFVQLLHPSGVVIISMPNIGHYSTIVNLLFYRYWPYRTRGIFDRTHLRFFTLRNIFELCSYANLEIAEVHRNYRLSDRYSLLNKPTRLYSLPVLRDFMAYQYLVVAHKRA